MQSAIEPATAQHIWNIPMFTQILTGQTKVPFEVQHRHNGGRHDLGIRHLALGIFMMLQGFEHVITQTKNDYNLGVHEFLLYVEVGIPQLYSKTHGLFYTSYPW